MMTITDARMVEWATEFRVSFAGTPLYVTRHDNHGGWLADGGWAVCHVRGALNPWYLSKDGFWRYKRGSSWPTARDAMAFLEHQAKPPGTMAPDEARAEAS